MEVGYGGRLWSPGVAIVIPFTFIPTATHGPKTPRIKASIEAQKPVTQSPKDARAKA